MKILYAALGYKPAYKIGGPVYTVSAAAEWLVRKGHEVIVFTTNANLDEDLDVPVNQPTNVKGVEVWYFKRTETIKKWLFFIPYLSKSIGFLYSAAMRKELSRLIPKVDVVHTQMPFIYPTYAAGNAALRHNKPLIYQQRGVFGTRHLKFRSVKKRLYINIIEKPMMRKASTLIALTQAEVNSYRALGVKTRCRIVPNGVDDEAQIECSNDNPIKGLNISSDDILILFMGRLHPLKGVETLITAFLNVCKRFPRAKLVIAGPDEWGMVEGQMQRINEAGLGNRVIFPGMITGVTKKMVMSRADLFCLPSAAEGFSMAVLEALVNSTGVLISPECNFPEVAQHGFGRIIEPEQNKLAEGLAALLSKPELLKEMGRMGRTYVINNYSWDKITDRLIETYMEGIEGTGSMNRMNPELGP